MRALQKPLILTLAALLLHAGMASAAERITYFVPDALGSPVAAMDDEGNLLWRASYSPHGSREVRPERSTAGPGYTGKPEDSDTGLV